jgi:membrane associated rhomboid family serine protease
MRTGWIELAAIPLALLLVYLMRTNHWMSGHVRTAWDWVRGWAKLAPFTTVLWVLVAVHVWMLVGLPPKVREAVLLVHSTTLSHLKREPLTVLFASAMWTDVSELLFMTVTAVVYMAPLERWIGSWRTVLAFLAGHVGATVLIALWIEATVPLTPQQNQVYARTIDVGVSYGAYCCAALLAYRLRMPIRLGVWAALLAYLLYQASLSDFDAAVDYTSLGHLTAFGIGLLLYPLVRSPRARARRNDPWIRVRPPRPGPGSSGFRRVDHPADSDAAAHNEVSAA